MNQSSSKFYELPQLLLFSPGQSSIFAVHVSGVSIDYHNSDLAIAFLMFYSLIHFRFLLSFSLLDPVVECFQIV